MLEGRFILLPCMSQKSDQTLFPLWFLMKKDILKLMKWKITQIGKTENIGKNVGMVKDEKLKLDLSSFALLLK